MKEIKYLLKFGKREHLQSLVEGNMYCSNAITFWGIEDKLKIKGQGDILEAGTRVFAHHMTLRNSETNEIVAEFGNVNALMRVDPAKRIPVFCLFAVYEEDCIKNADDKYEISLSEEKKQTIRDHFPDADAVVVIPNPGVFIDDIRRSIGTEIKADEVHYFQIDKGFETDNGLTAMDHEYMMYLSQDVPPEEVEGGKRFVFRSDFAYRVLFCKDEFFSKEQEYRIILPNDTIESGKSYPIILSTDYDLVDLNTFFQQSPILN